MREGQNGLLGDRRQGLGRDLGRVHCDDGAEVGHVLCAEEQGRSAALAVADERAVRLVHGEGRVELHALGAHGEEQLVDNRAVIRARGIECEIPRAVDRREEGHADLVLVGHGLPLLAGLARGERLGGHAVRREDEHSLRPGLQALGQVVGGGAGRFADGDGHVVEQAVHHAVIRVLRVVGVLRGQRARDEHAQRQQQGHEHRGFLHGDVLPFMMMGKGWIGPFSV